MPAATLAPRKAAVAKSSAPAAAASTRTRRGVVAGAAASARSLPPSSSSFSSATVPAPSSDQDTASVSASTSASASRTTSRTRAATSTAASSRSASSRSRNAAAATSAATAPPSKRSAIPAGPASSSRAAARTASKPTRPPGEARVAQAAPAKECIPSCSLDAVLQPLTEDQILQRLNNAVECDRQMISAIVGILGTDAADLGLRLEPPNSVGSPVYTALSASRASYFAKQMVNTILGSTTELINSGWSCPPETAANKTEGTTAVVPSSTSATKTAATIRTTVRRTAAATARSAEVAVEAPKGPTPQSVRMLVEAFRVASRFLLGQSARIEGSTPKKGKELEVETVMLRYLDKLIVLNLHDVLVEEVLYLRERAPGSPPAGSATKVDERLDQAILLPEAEWTPAQIAFLLELQSQAVVCRLQTLKIAEIEPFARLLEQDEGPLAWQRRGRNLGQPNAIKTADRAAYLMERSISKCLQRLQSPTNLSSLPLRSFGLQMLLKITDVDMDAFWDRVARTGSSCVRAAFQTGDIDGKRALEEVESMFQALVEAARERGESAGCGEGYANFCGTWTNLAKRAGSAESIDRAANAMVSGRALSPSANEASKETEVASKPTVSEEDLIRITATLLKAVVVMEQMLKVQECSAAAGQALSQSLDAIGRIDTWPSGAHHSTTGKLFKALEQARRKSLTLIDNSSAKASKSSRPSTPTAEAEKLPSTSTAEAVLPLLNSVLRLESAALVHLFDNVQSSSGAAQNSQIPSPLDHLTNLVYTFRFLANARFTVPSRPRQDECFDYLSQCSDLLKGSAKEALSLDVRSQNLFLISSSCYNIGGRLYSDRQYDAAARFLERACQTGSEAVALYQDWSEHRMEEDAASTEERLISPEEADRRQNGMTKKWEHLAVSYRLGSSKTKALQAYRRAIFSLSGDTWRRLESQAVKLGPHAIFLDAEWSPLASLLKSAIELCVFDLFKAQQVSEAESSIACWMTEFAECPAAAGLMLEHCVSVLEARFQHEEAPAAAVQLLEAAESIYDRLGASIRLSRVRLRAVEMELFTSAKGLNIDEVEGLLEKARSCLLSSATEVDSGLARFVPQYKATLAFLQVEVDQRRASPSSCGNIVNGVQQACRDLMPLLAAQGSPLQPSHRAKPSPNSAKPLATATSKAALPRPTPSTRVLKPSTGPPQPKAVPVTPPPRSSKLTTGQKGRSPNTGATAGRPRTSRAGPGSEMLDNPERFCNQLEHVYEALTTYGHTPSSIEVAKVLRRLSQNVLDAEAGREIYLRISASLAKQYLHLGKMPRAANVLSQALNAFQAPDTAQYVSVDTRFRCLMVSAEFLCRTGSYEKSVQRFEEAIDLARDEAVKGSSMAMALEKCRSVERRAIAAEVHSVILCSQGDLVGAIQSAVQAVRFGARMTTLLGRLTAPPSSRRGDQDKYQRNVFSAPTSDLHPIAAPIDEEDAKSERRVPKLSSFTVAAMHWRLSRLLVQAYLRVSQLYSIRGSGSDAEAFAGDGIELAEAMALSLALTRALIQRGEVRLQLGQVAQGQEDLSRSLAILQENWIPEAIVLTCIQGDSLAKVEQLPEALKSYAAGEASLRSLNAAFTELDAILPSPKPAAAARRSTPTSGGRRGSVGADALLPEVQGRLLRRQAWILQLLGRTEESEDLIDKAMAVHAEAQTSVDARVDQHLVQGRVSLRRALQQFKTDRLLSMLPDSAISMPMVPPSASSKALSIGAGSNAASTAAIKSALGLLVSADSSFTDALVDGGGASHALTVREAFISLAQVQTMQATLGKGSKGAAGGTAALVDLAMSVGVRRDLMHAISHKLKDKSALEDPNAWPSFRAARSNDDDDDDDDGNTSDCGSEDETAVLGRRMAKLGLGQSSEAERLAVSTGPARTITEYWSLVQGRYLSSQSATSRTSPDLLPRNWTVLSLTYLAERETLLLTRQTGGAGPDGCQANDPVIYSLPLDRQSHREMEQGELTMQAAQQRLDQIVRKSNDGIHGAKDVEGIEARKRWWTTRRELDKELEDLLAEMQDTWLGAFKGVFAEPVRDRQALASLRSRFDKIIKRSCFPPTTSNKKTSRLKLDDAVFECFAGFPADCTDEDFEDLLHYVMDALQFSGLQVAVDEVDLDEVAIDLRNALEEFRGKQAKAANACSSSSLDTALLDDEAGGQDGDQHLFLVLDKDTAMFPWESMPILRRRAVSRIPSMAFLQDRIDLARVYHRLPGEDERRTLSKGRRPKDGSGKASEKRRAEEEEASWKVALRNGRLFNLSKRRTSYLLNPGGDLTRTQQRFEPWLKGRASSGWTGIIGREPIVEELPRALTQSDLLLYFGHAGAEQYIRRSKVRELERCAVTMLFGCSSAMLRDHGEFDRTGTPLNYMCAGSPAMVGNLWDTTDRELDSVCEGILTKLGLMDEHEREAMPLRPAARPTTTTTTTTASSSLRAEQGTGASRRPQETSIVRAVAESRDECKLAFLTGAACVVYGVPVYWARDEDE